MEPLRAAVLRISAALDHAVRAEPVDQTRQRDRLQIENVGKFRLLQAFGVLETRHHGPLGAGNAQPTRALVRVGTQHAGYIIENERKFATGITWAHGFFFDWTKHKI